MRAKTLKLIEGEIGTAEGVELAMYLQDIGRTDIIDQFYDWVDTLSDEERAVRKILLHDWVREKHPEILAYRRITT